MFHQNIYLKHAFARYLYPREAGKLQIQNQQKNQLENPKKNQLENQKNQLVIDFAINK